MKRSLLLAVLAATACTNPSADVANEPEEAETTASHEGPIATETGQPAESELADNSSNLRLKIPAAATEDPAESPSVAASDETGADSPSAAAPTAPTTAAPKNSADAIAIGSLKGDVIGEARGFGGLGLHGVGSGGAGKIGNKGSIGERGIGLGNVGSAGRGGGSGYGRGSGNLGSRSVRRPKIVMGKPMVMGAMPRPDRQSNTEQYTHHGTNKFVDPSEDKLSTFSIDVDTGSYTIARKKLKNGELPPKAAVRVEEFVNYFRYDYPQPDDGPFAVSMEAAPSPFATNTQRHILRIGVQGKTIARKNRRPVHLTFLVDVSGSMGRSDKLPLVQDSLRVLTNNLQPQDSVAIATYAGRTAVLLEPTGLNERGRILAAIDELSAGGSTAMESGLELAYRLALKNFDGADENRVIVLSDGDANVGRRGHEEILKTIGNYVEKGVTLSTIGFGMGNYRDTLMEQLADKGNGNYSYIDDIKEARKVFGDQLDGTLQVIAKDVKIQVEFEPSSVQRYRLIGYENRDIADKDFRNDKVDAGEIGAGHTVTALYEVELSDAPADVIATVRVRHKQPKGSKATEQAFTLHRAELTPRLSDASADFQFAAAVTAFAEKLRRSPYAKDLSWELIEEIAQASHKNRADRREFLGLVKKARVL